MSLSTALQLFPLTACHLFSRQSLPRQPEPSAVTADENHVLAYDQVMQTKLAIAYALGIEVLYRARPVESGGAALDLASGPGHFSAMMAKSLALDSLLGLDLSPGMVETANANAVREGLKCVEFRRGNITKLEEFSDDSFDLVTFMHAAHHLDSLDDVHHVLTEMDRITRPGGLVVLMDLVRFKSAWLTNWYVSAMGADYERLGLSHFLKDFRDSMFAAWSIGELATTAPPAEKRKWRQLVARGLPTCQLLIGSNSQPLFQRAAHKMPKVALPPKLRMELRAARVLSFSENSLSS